MADMLATASLWLDGVCRTSISQTVRIRDGARKSEEIPATIGSTDFDEANNDGVIERRQSRDFLIAVADYKFGTLVVEPCEGHRIIEGDREYRVAALGDEPPFRYSDASTRTMWRIHTKLVCE